MSKKIAALILSGVLLLGGVAATIAVKPAAAPSGAVPAAPPSEPGANSTVTVDGVNLTRFTIQPDHSSARFTVDEVLAGVPNRVVGTTDIVSGQVLVDPTAPRNAQLGTILVNARSLATDDSQRNRALGNFILSTDKYEYISFSPLALEGIPHEAEFGMPYSFQIDGQLTIREVTRPATFAVTVTPVSPREIKGTASATIHYADWGITIPQVPLVASVADNVQLQMDFVATA